MIYDSESKGGALGTAVKPDNGIVASLASALAPDERRFPLVGDSQRLDPETGFDCLLCLRA